MFSGKRVVDGRTVYDYADIDIGDNPSTGTRTLCSSDWTDPAPCGMTLMGFEMSTPPAG